MQVRSASPSMIASKRAVQRQAGERRTAVAVDLHVRRAHAQSEQRAAHRQVRRLQDVQRSRFPRRRPRPPTTRAPRARILIASSARSSRLEHLGIADAADAAARIEDHRGRDDRSGQRSAAGLVDAREQAVASQIERQLCRTHRSPSTRGSMRLRLAHQFDDGVRRARARVAAQRLVDGGESLHELIAIGTLQLRAARAGPSTSARTSSLKILRHHLRGRPAGSAARRTAP